MIKRILTTIAFVSIILGQSQAHAASVSGVLDDSNPFDLIPGVVLDVTYGEFRGFGATIDTQNALPDTPYTYLFELRNVGTLTVSIGAWFSCNLCRGGFDAFDSGEFGGYGNPKTRIESGEAHVFSFMFTNPKEDAFGNMPTFRIALANVPLPAALPMLLAGIGGLGLMARRKRGSGRSNAA